MFASEMAAFFEVSCSATKASFGIVGRMPCETRTVGGGGDGGVNGDTGGS